MKIGKAIIVVEEYLNEESHKGAPRQFWLTVQGKKIKQMERALKKLLSVARSAESFECRMKV